MLTTLLFLGFLLAVVFACCWGSPPTPGAASTPSGKRLGDGYPTRLGFSLDNDLEFWADEITPVGTDTDAAIDTSTQYNNRWRTYHNGYLITLTPSTAVGMYDPVIITSLLAMQAIPQTITEHNPDGSSLAYYGYVKSAKRGPMKRGARPELTLEIQPTNMDPSDCSEQGPTFSAGAGTHC